MTVCCFSSPISLGFPLCLQLRSISLKNTFPFFSNTQSSFSSLKKRRLDFKISDKTKSQTSDAVSSVAATVDSSPAQQQEIKTKTQITQTKGTFRDSLSMQIIGISAEGSPDIDEEDSEKDEEVIQRAYPSDGIGKTHILTESSPICGSGSNIDGQLGMGTFCRNLLTYRELNIGDEIKSHSRLIDFCTPDGSTIMIWRPHDPEKDDLVLVSGNTHGGVLGIEPKEGTDEDCIFYFQASEGFSKTKRRWSRLEAGRMHCILQDQDGKMWGIGSNQQGQLGLGRPSSTSIPTAIPLPVG